MSKLSIKEVQSLIEELRKLNISSYGSDFLRTWDKEDDEIKATLKVMKIIREMYNNNISPRVFDSGIAISIFKDNSTRTRYSHASATNLLGLLNQELDMGKSQLAHGETVMETANMISFLTRSIGIRDDKYLGVGQKYMQEYAKSVQKGFEEGSIEQRPTVVNLQCDEDHPTQSMCDLGFLVDYFGGIENLKNKKMTMSWAYSPSYGKPMSVPQGIIALMSRFGMDITLAYPEGYNLIPEIEELAADNASESGGSFKIVNDMAKSVEEADIVYPKSWAPYHVMEERTELLKQNDDKGLAELEKRALKNNSKFKNWEYTKELEKTTKDGNALYMHCLPADITGLNCEAGEVDSETFAKWRKETYVEASYKPNAIAAMITLGQFGEKAADILELLLEKKNPIKIN